MPRLTEEQVASRRQRMHATDIVGVAGLLPATWRGSSAIDIWREKIGDTQPFAGNEATEAGHDEEPVICNRYVRRMRLQHSVEVMLEEPDSLVHPQHDWLAATPDRIQVMPTKKVVEAKNVGWRVMGHWKAGPPVYVTAQNILQQACADIHEGIVLGRLGGSDDVEHDVPWSEAAFKALFEIAHEFWFKFVKENTPPPIDASEGWKAYLAELYPSAKEPMLLAPPEAQGFATDVLAAKAQIEQAKGIIAAGENQIKALIGDARGIESDAFKALWTDRRGSVDWKAVATEAWRNNTEFTGTLEAFAEKHRRNSTRTFRLEVKNDD